MTDKELKDWCKTCSVEPPAMKFKCSECEHNPDEKQIICDTYNTLTRECSGKPDTPLASQIIIDGVDVRSCEYIGFGIAGTKSVYPCQIMSKILPPVTADCSNFPKCQFKELMKQLARKTQECEELKEKLYQIEDVVKPINEQLPEDSVIRQIMLILNDCNGLESSRYRKALEEIETVTKINCEEICGRKFTDCNDTSCFSAELLDIINKAKGGVDE